MGDVRGWLAAGMTREEIIEDIPELSETDILRVWPLLLRRKKDGNWQGPMHEAAI